MISFKSTGIQVERPEAIVCELKNILNQYPGVEIEENIHACNLTSFCIGGRISLLITLNDESSVHEVLKAINTHGLEILVLGAGTKLLVSDTGFDGVFIKLGDNFRKIEQVADDRLLIGGAAKISEVISHLRKNNLSGLAFMSGIPGTLGGAIAMNAGAFGDEIKNHVVEVNAVTLDGRQMNLTADMCEFDYRKSRFKKEKSIILNAAIKVEPGKSIDDEVEERLAHRSIRHTPHGRYAGSVFKNPPGDFAGKLLDDAGMRGMRVGSAYVSEKHANFILADENAKASDVLELMQIAAIRVFVFNGVKLYPEIDLIGFDLIWDDIFNS